jgi:hypothetical protein
MQHRALQKQKAQAVDALGLKWRRNGIPTVETVNYDSIALTD